MEDRNKPTQLVSHGWRKRCEVCERQSHAKWHEYTRGPINPVALIEFVERQRATCPAVCDAIIGWTYAVTGMDIHAMRASLEAERISEERRRDRSATE